MNTGVQRSGATPPAARTATTRRSDRTGQRVRSGKDMPRLPWRTHLLRRDRDGRRLARSGEQGRTRNATARRALPAYLVPCPLGWDRPRATRSRSLASLRRPVSSGIRSRERCRHRRLKDPSSHERRIVSLDSEALSHLFAGSGRPTSLLESKRWLIRTSRSTDSCRRRARRNNSRGVSMTELPFAITLEVGSSHANRTGCGASSDRCTLIDSPVQRRVPAGENIQQWLYHAESGAYETAWRQLVWTIIPAVMGRSATTRVKRRAIACKSMRLWDQCHRAFLGDLAIERGWRCPRRR